MISNGFLKTYDCDNLAFLKLFENKYYKSIEYWVKLL